MAVGLALTIWPGVVHHALSVPPADGVVSSLLAAVSILAALGIRYPLQMLPLLLFELLWKSIRLIAFALPLWSAGRVDTATRESIFACLMGIVILPIVIPWPYVFANYVRNTSERWRPPGTGGASRCLSGAAHPQPTGSTEK
jgi:hypothetical protein